MFRKLRALLLTLNFDLKQSKIEILHENAEWSAISPAENAVRYEGLNTPRFHNDMK